jgi:two-component system phosphate regulon sensor histidine kinase PhoR
LNKTYKFALITSAWLTLFVGLSFGGLMFLYFDSPNYQFLISGLVFFFLFSFLLIQFRVERFIYKRIKGIMKRVSVLDVKDVNQNSMTTDLDELSSELEELAEKNRLEIVSLNKQEAYRREFLGNVAHEMKTPIFTIQGYLITLLEGAGEDKEIREKYLERAIKGVDRLEAVVKDLDMISKLETKDVNPVMENFNLLDLIQNIFDILDLKSSKKGITVRFAQFHQFPIIVNADKEKIEQVLLNLVENSIKYGRVNGFTEVRIDESQLGRVKIDIVDNGEGMDKQHLNRVFERFYRVEKSRNRDQGGSGLGLSIVKHILEAHNQETPPNKKTKHIS